MQIVSIILGVVFLLAPLQVFAGSVYCECSRYLRQVLQINVPQGNAGTYWPNKARINVDYGDVVIFRYPNLYHVSLIIGFEWEEGRQMPTHLVVAESNFTRCTPGIRRVAWEDENIIGFYNPPPALATF